MSGIWKALIILTFVVVGATLYIGTKIKRFNRCMEEVPAKASIATADSCFGRRLTLDSTDRVYFMYAFQKDQRVTDVVVYQPIPGWPDIAVIGLGKEQFIVETHRWASP